MKITKKLAKEIFMGNFSNVSFDEQTKKCIIYRLINNLKTSLF